MISTHSSKSPAAAPAGTEGPTKKVRDYLLADSLIYGLINVRTDGKKV